MKNILIIVALLFALDANAQVNKKQLSGMWQAVSPAGKDCTEILEFNEDGKYKITNTCFGTRESSEADEHGRWALNGKVLSLRQRTFANDYNFKGKTKQYNCSVGSIEKGQLTLVFMINGTEVKEVYKKVQGLTE